ncbi:adenosine kinase [Lacimicrobium sp. SS2-24]|uniref:adenosine kinase n=1 Tax=Lacimicrobium sp. SS2-24 TaxID=2005569 RepID=UPI000B4BB677|nr:adenosine kinase [Lacimicrobium sp. SS2-24]
MSDYDVVALGNALVDKEFQVSEAFLKEQGIEKGVMTLIDRHTQLALLENLYQHCDLRNRAGGGSAVNSMVTAAQFGSKVFCCCKVGDDELGHFYQQDLAAAGVDNRLEEQATKGDTGRCVVMITPDTERTMCTFLGVTTDFSVDELHEQPVQKAQYLYIEGHLVYSDTAVEAILKAKRLARDANVKIALTFSDPAVVKYARDNLEKVIGDDGVDLLFCNKDEVLDYAGNQDLDTGIKKLREIANLIVVTHGKHGARIYNGSEDYLPVAPYKVKAVDATGAGDTFAGAFLHGITQGMSLSRAGDLASRAASECVASFGPRLSSTLQQDILSEFN